MAQHAPGTNNSSLGRQIVVAGVLALVGGLIGLLFTYHRQIYAWVVPPRPAVEQAVTQAETAEAIAQDLEGLAPEEQPSYRYLTMNHLFHPAVSEEHRARARDGLRQALAWAAPEGQTCRLEPLGRHNSVLRIRLSDLGWEAGQQWRTLLEHYPYGLDGTTSTDPRVASAETRIRKASADLPFLRGDWLAARLCVPPLAGKGGVARVTREVPPDLRKFALEYDEEAIDLARAARELNSENPQAVRAKILAEKRLLEKQGLTPLTAGGTITRAAWESRRFGTSAYQELARDLGLGVPEAH